ncbi:MAG: FecR domain-containing protein [Acetatifactor sp.]
MSTEKKNKALPIIIGVVVATMLIIILAVVGICVVLPNLGIGYRVVKLENFDGTVKLTRKEKEAKIFKDMNLKAQDKVATGANSMAELLADSDKHILARENTGFSIETKGNKKKGKITIHLDYGTTLIEIDNKLPAGSEFEVKTSNAISAVRGTTFEVTYDKLRKETIVVVEKGIVEVTTQKDTVRITAGNSASVIGTDGDINHTQQETGIFRYTSNIAFTLKGKDAEVGVKSLTGWEYTPASGDEYGLNRFDQDGVSFRYSILNKSEYKKQLGSKDGELVQTTNAEGTEIAVKKYAVKGGLVYGYSLYKQISDNTYLNITIFDTNGGESLERYDETSLLNLTKENFYIINNPSSDASEDLSGDNGDNPESSESEIDNEQLQFLISCMLEGKTEEKAIQCALRNIYYHPSSEFYAPIEKTSNGNVYSIAELEKVLAPLSSNRVTITEDNIFALSRMEGANLVYDICDVSEGGSYSVFITKFTADSLISEIEFQYTHYLGSDGSEREEGTGRVALVQKGDGSVYLNGLEVQGN